MSQEKNLSKAELAAIDYLIAYMQENNKTQLGGFIDSVVQAVSDAANNSWSRAITVMDDSALSRQIIANINSVANAAGGGKLGSEFAKTMQQLDNKDIASSLTLENLIAIKNRYAK